MSIAYILKSTMAAILVFAHGPKSIAPVFSVVWYHISKLKSIGVMVLKISRSQVRQTEGRTDGRKDGREDGRPAFLCRHFYVLPKLHLQKTIKVQTHWHRVPLLGKINLLITELKFNISYIKLWKNEWVMIKFILQFVFITIYYIMHCFINIHEINIINN